MNQQVDVGATLAGKYRVLRVLGQGGMGTVVEALHEELDQRVAIKLMLKEAAQNGEWAARFSREARAAARIKSDHVVRVSDVGKLESGQPYMVMELLDGEDLQAMISRHQRLPIPKAIDFLLQTCEALAEAHALGIVHRDLKPANLFVTERGGDPWIKVLDFGISKVANDPGSVTVTNTSAIVGSPLYMSPEQMRASKTVDARADIWALGVILQEMITGRTPFEGQTQPELCALVLTAPPSRLSESIPNVPPALEAVVLKCLEKDPSKRFANVAELAHTLAEISPMAKPAADRIVRALGKSRQPSLVSALPQPETARIAITPDPSNATMDMGDTIASSELKPAPRVVEGPTMLSAGQRAEPPPAPDPAPVPVTPQTSTAAAWGNTGGSFAGPKHSMLPFAIGAGVLGALLIAVVAVVALRKPEPATATEPPKAATTTASPAPPGTTSEHASHEPDASPPAFDINALPTTTAKVTATTTAKAVVKPVTTPSAPPPIVVSAKPKPTNDTSEFGGRK